MKKALSEILIQNYEQKKIFISIVKKQSDLGLTQNPRVFVLIQNTQFGYISKFKESDKPSDIDLEKLKQRIPIKNLIQVDQDKTKLRIYFWKQQSGKKIKKNWVLTMSHQQMANKWKDLLAKQKSYSSIKRRSSNHSPSKSQLIKKSEIQGRINKSQVKLQSYQNQLYESEKNKDKNQSPQKQVARKLDYDAKSANFIIQQDPRQDKVSDMNQKRNAIDPINYNNLRQLQRRKEEQRLRQQKQRQYELQRQRQKQQIQRQKQKLLRQKIEMQNREKALRQQQKRLAQQKIKMSKLQQKQQDTPQLGNQSSKYGKGKEITVLNQKYFKVQQKQTDKYQKNSHKKVQLNNKPKSKLDNKFNYYQIVNKLVANNQVQQNNFEDPYHQNQYRKQQLQEAHDYIFELERQKLANIQRQRLSKIDRSKPAQKEQVSLGWTFKYLAKEAQGKQFQVILDFSAYCQHLLKELVDEFYLPQYRKIHTPKYKCQEYYAYQVDDVEFKVAILGIKQVYNSQRKQQRDHICDSSHVKILQTQFKNYQILYEACKNQGLIKMPLVCLSEYRGFIALFKANSYFDQKGMPRTLEPRVQTSLQRISENLKISIETFKLKGNLLILKLDQKVYRQLALNTNSSLTRFDFYMIQQIKYLMPPDVLYNKKYNEQGDNLATKNIGITVLRKQMLKLYLHPDQKISNTIYLTLQKDKLSTKNLRDSHIQLEQVSQNILVPITDFIKQLDDLQFCYISPTDISNRMHCLGINMRYLGLIHQHCNLNFNKSCLLSEIAARTCKILLRKTIQDLYLADKQNQQHNFNKQAYNQSVVFKLIDFFNCILGNSGETIAIWSVLSAHSMNYYNTKLQYDFINKGMFLISLVHHCGLIIDWSSINISSMFQQAQFFNEQNFYGTRFRTKSYQPNFSQKQEQIFQEIIKENPQYFNQLLKMYDLSIQNLPQKVLYSKYAPYIKKYLTNFIPPHTTGNFKHLKLYQLKGQPSQQELDIQFMELKWYLRNKKKQKYIRAFTNLMTQINSYFGDYHPIMSQLYDTFSLYHLNNGEFQDSITFAKSSVVNTLKICGANHFKTAQNYFQLAKCCIKAGKKEQAIINLQKSKKIFEACQKVDTTSYALVTLKLGQLFLSQQKIQEAEQIVKYSLDILIKGQKFSKRKFQDEKVQGYEYLFRCYELQELNKEIQLLGRQIEDQLRYIQSSHNFQKLMKIAIHPILKKHSAENCSCYIDVISMLQIQPSTQKYIKAFQRLKDRITEQSFFQNLQSYLENVTTIQKYIVENSALKRWRTFQHVYERQTINDFVSFSQQILYFLGQGFVTGILRQNL